MSQIQGKKDSFKNQYPEQEIKILSCPQGENRLMIGVPFSANTVKTKII